jgi:hypothetical protein
MVHQVYLVGDIHVAVGFDPEALREGEQGPFLVSAWKETLLPKCPTTRK